MHERNFLLVLAYSSVKLAEERSKFAQSFVIYCQLYWRYRAAIFGGEVLQRQFTQIRFCAQARE